MVKLLSKKQTRLHEAENGFSGIIQIPVDSKELEATWVMPAEAEGIVLFAHGSGSSRHSKRNQFVASKLVEAGLGTVLLDLLTNDEESDDLADTAFKSILRLKRRLLQKMMEEAIAKIKEAEQQQLEVEKVNELLELYLELKKLKLKIDKELGIVIG